MTAIEIATELGLTPSYVRRSIKAGMPTDNMKAILAWREQRAESNRQARRMAANTPERHALLERCAASARAGWHNMKVERPNKYQAIRKNGVDAMLSARQRMKKNQPDKYQSYCEKSVKPAHEKCRGSNGFGRCHRGSLDHPCAKEWTIQSPDGERYTFPNLCEWCRKNEHLFDDDGGEYKTPSWLRAVWKLSNSLSWRGWIVIDRGPLPTTTKR